VVTCSSACVPTTFAQEYEMVIVPLTLIIGDRIYRDGVDITGSDFYAALKQNYNSVSTSAPSVGDYLRAFSGMKDRFEKVVCVTLAKGISLCNAAATRAGELSREIEVEVFDSETAATGQALVAMEAARLAREGLELKEVLEGAKEVAQKVKVLGALDTLNYLKMSGRVNSLSAITAEMLNIKPVFVFERGEAKLLAKTISKRRALERIAQEARDRFEKSGPIRLAVFHAMAYEEAEMLEKIIKENAECIDSFIAEFTPVMGKHTGPGLVGASFC